MTNNSTTVRSRKLNPVYTTLPRHLLAHPPIRHRHSDDKKRHLSPFEFAIAAALAAAARSSLADDRHAEALAAGKQAIRREKVQAEDFKQQWRETKTQRRRGMPTPAPTRAHTFTKTLRRKGYPFEEYTPHKPAPIRRTLKVAGQEAYKKRARKLRRQPPEIIKIEFSRSALLRLAGLSADGSNLRKLDAALNRLMEPTATDGCFMRSLVIEWQQLPSGRLALTLSGEWLAPPFARIPMPLPTRSPNAMALYLFLHFVDTSPLNKTTISLDALGARLGIPVIYSSTASRALDRALDIINFHLGSLDAGALEGCRIKVPDRYEIRPADGRLRFEAIPRQVKEFDDDGEPEAAFSRKKVAAAPLHQSDREKWKQEYEALYADVEARNKRREEWTRKSNSATWGLEYRV